jgi:hypothetical protein
MLQSIQATSSTMKHTCPDCAAPLETFATPSTDPGYICPTHGKFVVTGSSEDFGFWQAPLARQRRALQSARLTATALPIVILYA